MSRNDLDHEYSERAARQSASRALEQRRKENERLALASEPIADDTQLAAAVARLGKALGGRVTRRKERKQS